MKIEKDFTKKGEVSLTAFEDEEGKKYKVTRRMPNMSVAETKFFKSKDEAKKQYEEWLK